MGSTASVWGICLVASKIEMKMGSLMREYVFPGIFALVAKDFQENVHNFKRLNLQKITSIATFLGFIFFSAFTLQYNYSNKNTWTVSSAN